MLKRKCCSKIVSNVSTIYLKDTCASERKLTRRAIISLIDKASRSLVKVWAEEGSSALRASRRSGETESACTKLLSLFFILSSALHTPRVATAGPSSSDRCCNVATIIVPRYLHTVAMRGSNKQLLLCEDAARLARRHNGSFQRRPDFEVRVAEWAIGAKGRRTLPKPMRSSRHHDNNVHGC